MIHHDHCPIGKIPDGLIAFATFLHEIQLNLVAGRRSGSQRSRKIGQIQCGYTLKTRDLTERLVICKQPRMTQPRGADEPADPPAGRRHRPYRESSDPLRASVAIR